MTPSSETSTVLVLLTLASVAQSGLCRKYSLDCLGHVEVTLELVILIFMLFEVQDTEKTSTRSSPRSLNGDAKAYGLWLWSSRSQVEMP